MPDNITTGNICEGVQGEVRKMVDHAHVDNIHYILEHKNKPSTSSNNSSGWGGKKKKPIVVRQTLFLLLGKCFGVLLVMGFLQAAVLLIGGSVDTASPLTSPIPDSDILDVPVQDQTVEITMALDGIGGSAVSILTFVIQLIQFSILLYIFGRWFTTRYILTQEDIIYEYGMFTRKRNMYATANVESIELRQTFIQRLANFGTICLYAPTLNQSIYLYNIPAPLKIQKKLDRFIHPDQKNDSNFRVLSDGAILP